MEQYVLILEGPLNDPVGYYTGEELHFRHYRPTLLAVWNKLTESGIDYCTYPAMLERGLKLCGNVAVVNEGGIVCGCGNLQLARAEHEPHVLAKIFLTAMQFQPLTAELGRLQLPSFCKNPLGSVASYPDAEGENRVLAFGGAWLYNRIRDFRAMVFINPPGNPEWVRWCLPWALDQYLEAVRQASIQHEQALKRILARK